MDIYSDEAAEALWRFVNQDEIYEDFCVKNEFYDMSILEYVVEFCLDDFKAWSLSELGIVFN